MKSTGIGDSSFWGPEDEFFVFDDVRYEVSPNQTFYFIDSDEGPYNTGSIFEDGNLGHRPPVKGGYFPVPPVDSAMDLRSEEHTSELPSLMRISYAVFCLKKKNLSATIFYYNN